MSEEFQEAFQPEDELTYPDFLIYVKYAGNLYTEGANYSVPILVTQETTLGEIQQEAIEALSETPYVYLNTPIL
jgi:tRNA(Ser,Leu) C12 N-acetylase TAN1